MPRCRVDGFRGSAGGPDRMPLPDRPATGSRSPSSCAPRLASGIRTRG